MWKFLRAAALTSCACVALAAQCASTFSSDATDLWWNPDESGWGVNVTQQGNEIVATLFVYSADGKAHWFVAPAAASSASHPVFTGALYETTGPVFSTSFNPNLVTVRQVGTLSFDYTPPNSARLTYSVDGATVTKSVVRQTWSAPTLQTGYHIWRTVRGPTGCTIGSISETMVVSQSGSSVNIQLFGGGNTPRCTMNGTIQQNGRMASITGTATCNGSTGPFAFTDMEIGIHGFTARYDGQDLNGCVLSGHVGGVVDSPP